MSLTETNLLSVAKTQYRYKTKANFGLFFTLIAAQLLALLITYSGGVSSSGGGSANVMYSIRHMSGDIVIIFTLIWAFAVGMTLAGNGFRSDFTFVTNRLSSHLSSMAFLATAGIAGGITATLSGVLLRVILALTHDNLVQDGGFWVSPSVLATGTFAAAFYTLLLGAVGYFAGMLILKNRAFIVILPGLFFGTLFVEARSTGQAQTIIRAIEFFTKESALPMLGAKAIVVSALLLGAVILFSDRMEVRQ